MNCVVTVPDTGCLIECFDAFMRANRPTLDDILGAACELYRIDPDDIKQDKARPVIRAFCYFAARWARQPVPNIAAHIKQDRSIVNSTSWETQLLRRQDSILRDDIDLLAVRIAERVMTRRRLAKCKFQKRV